MGLYGVLALAAALSAPYQSSGRTGGEPLSRFGHLPTNQARQGRKDLEKRRAKNKAAAKSRKQQRRK